MKPMLQRFALASLCSLPFLAISAAAPPSAQPTFVGSNTVAAAFAKGMPLQENNEFKVHASRRDAPGVAEVHTRDTDIIHVLEGSAIFVTGGTAVDPQTIAPHEVRGKEIKGGQDRRINKGDVIIVPNGVPHWFKQVDGPLLYFVVKVTSTSTPTP